MDVGDHLSAHSEMGYVALTCSLVQDCARFSSPLKSRKKRRLRRQLSFHTHSSCPFHSNFLPSPPPLLKKRKKVGAGLQKKKSMRV